MKSVKSKFSSKMRQNMKDFESKKKGDAKDDHTRAELN